MKLYEQQEALCRQRARELEAQAQDVRAARHTLKGFVAEPTKTLRGAPFDGPFATRMLERARDISENLKAAVEQLEAAERLLLRKREDALNQAAFWQKQSAMTSPFGSGWSDA